MASSPTKPRLTHPHLSKLEKTKKRDWAAEGQDHQSRHEWAKFHKLVEAKVKVQRGYVQQREELVTQFRTTGLAQLPAEMQQMALNAEPRSTTVDLENDGNFVLDLTADVEDIQDDDMYDSEPEQGKRQKKEDPDA